MGFLIQKDRPPRRYLSLSGAVLLAGFLVLMGIVILQNAFGVWPRHPLVRPEVSLRATVSAEMGRSDVSPERIRELEAEFTAALAESAKARFRADPFRPRLLGIRLRDRQVSWDTRLFLIAVIFGALGSWVHAGASFARFAGNRQLVSSWSAWYLIRPMLGAGLALIFYVVLRTGLVTSGGLPLDDVSHYSVAAFGALVGLFTQRATQKLSDVFNALFTPSPEHEDKDSIKAEGDGGPPRIGSVSPSWVRTGTDPVEVKLTGTGFLADAVVKVDGNAAPTKREGESALTFTLESRYLKAKASLELTVETEAGVSPSARLLVTP